MPFYLDLVIDYGQSKAVEDNWLAQLLGHEEKTQDLDVVEDIVVAPKNVYLYIFGTHSQDALLSDLMAIHLHYVELQGLLEVDSFVYLVMEAAAGILVERRADSPAEWEVVADNLALWADIPLVVEEDNQCKAKEDTEEDILQLAAEGIHLQYILFRENSYVCVMKKKKEKKG